MFRLPIICCNGIGDSLLILGRIPIRSLAAFGIRFNVFYVSPGNSAGKILVPFFKEIKYARYVERPPGRFEKILFQKLISFFQRFGRIWPVPYSRPCNPEKSDRNIPSQGAGKWILIQSHLDGHHGWQGATAKMWKIENWISLIRTLRESNHNIGLMEWDAAAKAQIQTACPYVVDAGKGSLWELCLQMKRFDCVISVDSWVKYAAAWSGSHQVIFVPDLRKGYTPDFANITADWVAKWWFHGLLDNARVHAIGLAKQNGKYEYTLASINDLKPEQVAEVVTVQLKKD